MISRHIPHKVANDNYRRLARYIADASHQGEKALMSWCAGCWSGDDEYELGIEEAELIQSLNTRSAKEKTYHLVVSFRPEDEANLTPEVFKEIELEFAKTLGFSEHQRHAGVHQNTDNLHLHVAYNMIHPERRTRHEPYRDFEKRDQLCRALEQKYGLAIDNGRDKNKAKVATNEAAKAYEAHTGQESLFSYAQRHKESIMEALAQANSWSDCHQIFAHYGLRLKPQGNGLVVQAIDGNQSIKASDLDRALSKSKLSSRLGTFEAPAKDQLQAMKPDTTYTAAPLQINPDRDNLYSQFKTAMQQRRDALESINQQDTRLYKITDKKWEQTRKRIKAIPMTRRDRQQVMKKFNEKRSAEQKALRNQVKLQRDEVRDKYPFKSWAGYLRHMAAQGNETALAILRSKNKETTVRKQASGIFASPKPHGDAPEVVSQVTELLRRESPGVVSKSPQYTIDGKGTVIIKLPGGGIIRDAGSAIHFNSRTDKERRLAEKLRQLHCRENPDYADNMTPTSDVAQPSVSSERGLSR